MTAWAQIVGNKKENNTNNNVRADIKHQKDKEQSSEGKGESASGGTTTTGRRGIVKALAIGQPRKAFGVEEVKRRAKQTLNTQPSTLSAEHFLHIADFALNFPACPRRLGPLSLLLRLWLLQTFP